jgi:hypothetical protein
MLHFVVGVANAHGFENTNNGGKNIAFVVCAGL